MKLITPITLLALTATATLSSAATLVFDDGGADSAIGTAENWDSDTTPTINDDLIIGTAFSATGSIGGSATPANSLLLQGSLSGTWALVGITIDGGSLTVSGAGGAFGGGNGSADIINGGTMTFINKTAAEVNSQYESSFTIGGVAAEFGSDPLVLEAGDNAFIVENGAGGADNVTVFSAIPEPSSTALLGLGGLALIMRRRK